jgi:hypothetical protein
MMIRWVETWGGILGWDILVFMSRCVRVSSYVIYVYSCINESIWCDVPSWFKTEFDANGI